MPVIDFYSDRKRRTEGGAPDVLTYDLPDQLRVQIVYILKRAIGERPNPAWKSVHEMVAEGHGQFALADGRTDDQRCINFVLHNPSADHVLDLIEVSFRFIGVFVRKFSQQKRRDYGIRATATASIERLNERFQRAGVGYQFESGRIVRMDSELIHSEVVRPALQFLHQPGFAGPREEFLRAHSHYRAGRTKEAVTTANNALENTLKAICDQRRWEYDGGATGPRLVKLVRANGLLPDYLENSFEQLAGVLKSSLSGVRNNVASHGQGSTPRETPMYVAAYALHLAAAKILFLVEAHKATT